MTECGLGTSIIGPAYRPPPLTSSQAARHSARSASGAASSNTSMSCKHCAPLAKPRAGVTVSVSWAGVPATKYWRSCGSWA